MNASTQARVAVLLGVCLLLSPAAVGAVDLGAETNHYNVGYVAVSGDDYSFTGQTYGQIDRDVLCWGSVTRACQLERSLLTDTVSIEATPVYYDRATDYRFVFDDGAFYEAEWSDTELSLSEVTAAAALRATSTGADAVPSGVRDAFEDGQTDVATHAELPTHQLIRVETGRYATVVSHYTDRTPVDEVLDAVEPWLGPVGFVIGLGLVLSGQRWRVRERHRRRN